MNAPADRGSPIVATLEDGTVVGFDPGFGSEWAAVVKMCRNPDGTFTFLETKTWPIESDAASSGACTQPEFSSIP
jgi:hypothetical protein